MFWFTIVLCLSRRLTDTDDWQDAEDAVHQFNGKTFMGSWLVPDVPSIPCQLSLIPLFHSIVVEFAKESRPRRDPYDGDRGYPPRARRPGGYRVIVQNISRDTSWQVSRHCRIIRLNCLNELYLCNNAV